MTINSTTSSLRSPSSYLPTNDGGLGPHPHNIRRFFGEDYGRVKSFGPDDVSDQAHWEQLPHRLKREVLDILPPHVIAIPSKLFLAARVWMEVRDRNYSAVQRFLKTFVRNKPILSSQPAPNESAGGR